LGPKILVLKSIGRKSILNFHWLLKDEETIDCREGFRSLKGSRGTSSRKVKRLTKEEEYVVLKKGKKGRE
jgi:hypothetical protein